MRGLFTALIFLFFVSALKGQSPGGVATTLNLWLKADSGPEKSPGVAAGNGDAISLWKDKGPFARDYTVTAGPTLQTGMLNFNPAVQILSGGFNAPAGSELSTDWTVFFISKKLPSDLDGRLFEGNTGNNLWAQWGPYTNSIYLEGNPSNFNSGIATTTGIQNLHLHAYKRAASGSLEARADGSSLATFTGTSSANGIRIGIDRGTYTSSGAEASDAQVGEMIMYSSSLTSTEMNRIESYLAIKYGLTVAHDYVASDATVIWNSTSNATYHHDVAGIGKDAASSLDQPKSQSINSGADITMQAASALADKNFIIWGNDGVTGTSSNISASYFLRARRIWKTAVMGAPGSITVSVNIAAAGLPNTTLASDYVLLRDVDTDFSSVVPAPITAASLAGGVLTFNVPGFSNNEFFTIAMHNAPAPGGTAGAGVWLKADLGLEKAGGLPAANGDAITSWRDQSGYSRDYTVVAGPTRQDNALNFNPAVEILAGGFDAPVGSELSIEWTMFFISRKLPSDIDGRVFEGNTGNNLWAHWGSYTNSIYIEGNPSNYNSGIATTAGIQNLHLHSYKRANTGSIEARADGSSLATFTGTNSASGIRMDIAQGPYSSTSESSDARIGEMILFPSALTATEVLKVESYLGIKYGLTLAHDYQSADGTVIWNATAFALYHNDVTGIGRDDKSMLDQRQSLNVNTGAAVTIQNTGLAAFGSDKTFAIIGHSGSTGTNSNVLAPYKVRTNKVWRTAVTGTPGALTLKVDLALLGLPNTTVATDYAVLRDADNDFTAVGPAPVVASSIAGSVLTFDIPAPSLTNGQYFTIAASNVVIPGGVAGLLFWVKGDAGISATNVDRWIDQSGLGNDALQPVAAKQPLQQLSDLNFNPTVNFFQAASIMSLTTPPVNLNTTIFAVGIPKANNDWRTMFRGAANDHPLLIESGGTRLGYFDNDNAGFNPSGFTWLQNEPALVGVEMRTGNVNFRKNGTQGISIGGIILNGLNLDYFGAYQGGSQNFGKIAEAIVYNTTVALTSTEKNKIESYLAIKYGLTLTHDYLASDGTTLWNSTTNSVFHHDVAGIGRDDNSALDQRKSLSVNSGSAITIQTASLAAFGSDKNFILWGNDATTGTSTNISSSYTLRTKRVWKTAVTGVPGAVTVFVDLTSLGLPNTGSAADYALLRDVDTDFTTVVPPAVVATSLVANVLTFNVPSFTDGQFFTISAANIPTPGGVFGLVFWVKASAGVNGVAAIDRWSDQSGTGNDATQSTSLKQPSLMTPDINGYPSVNFFQPTSIMNLTTPTVNLNSTIFSVGVPTANSDWRTMFRGVTEDHPILIENGTNRLGYYDNSAGAFVNSGLSWAQNEVALVTTEMRTGNVNYRKNGTQGSSIGSINLSGPTIDYIGAYQGGSQNFGRIAEAMIYTTAAALTTTEKNKIESYMAVKYGITLTHDYLATDGTITWNATTNAAYQNRVTGVGRDNATGLDQRTSTSVHTGAAVTMLTPGLAAFGTDKSFILWGDNNAAMAASGVTDYPASQGLIGRIARAWKIARTGTPGTINIRFNLATIPGSKTAADLRLLIDRDKNGVFANETVGGGGVVNGAVDLGSDIFEFSGITLNDGELISIGTVSATTPLPITLISLKAVAEDNAIRITWSTSTEINNDYFTLQKSVTGSEFMELARIAGAGNSTATNNYGYTDTTPENGLNYYRLKQTDFDGNSSLSGIIKVDFSADLLTETWKAYPNPATGQFSIEGVDLEKTQLTISNSLGQRVNPSVRIESGKVIVDAASLPRGLYLITVSANGKTQAKKIILQ